MYNKRLTCKIKGLITFYSTANFRKTCSAVSSTTKGNLTSKVFFFIFFSTNMDNAGIRNLRDILLQYNKISESCFLSCVNHLTDRSLSQDEGGCVDMCAKKFMSVNHKVMQVYIEIQPLLINKRIEEANKQNAALEAAQQNEIDGEQQQSRLLTNGKLKIENVHKPTTLVDVRPPSNLPDKDVIRTEYQ